MKDFLTTWIVATIGAFYGLWMARHIERNTVRRSFDMQAFDDLYIDMIVWNRMNRLKNRVRRGAELNMFDLMHAEQTGLLKW
jgi:hypothetical protein